MMEMTQARYVGRLSIHGFPPREPEGRCDGVVWGVQDFLARNAPRGTGRGAGTFHRFVSHHEETVVAAEEKTFKNFTKRRGGDRRFADVDE